MSTKRTIELKGMDVDTLKNELAELEASLSTMSFEHSVKGLANPLVMNTSKKEIAKIHTELRNRELAAMSTEELAGRSRIRLRRKLKK